MKGSLKDQLMGLAWRISNLTEHCAFHKGDKDAKRLLKELKAKKKKWVDGLRRKEENIPLLRSLKLIRGNAGVVSKKEKEKTEKVSEKVEKSVPAEKIPGVNFPSHSKVMEYVNEHKEAMDAFLERRGGK